jgi:hypothetical protein
MYLSYKFRRISFLKDSTMKNKHFHWSIGVLLLWISMGGW